MVKEKKQKKNISFWSVIILTGFLAGILGSQLFSWLGSLPALEKISWLCKNKNATTIINKTERVYVSQDTAYQEAINKVGNAVVAVRAERVGRKAIESSGFILTSDGLVATANFSASKGAKILVLREGKEYEAELFSEDKENNLTLLKISETNLPVVNFGEAGNLKLGETVFLAGASKVSDNFTRFTNLAFIKSLTPQPAFTFNETALADGAALGNIKGEVLGICLVNKDGSVKLVDKNKIIELMK